MSADNWAVCPRCHDAWKAHVAELQARVRDGYGVMPLDEFDALRTEAAKPIDTEALSTFREDYEIGTDEGELYVRYHGKCEKCGLEHSYKHEEVFYGDP